MRLLHGYNVPTVHFTGLLTFSQSCRKHIPWTEMYMNESQNASNVNDTNNYVSSVKFVSVYERVRDKRVVIRIST